MQPLYSTPIPHLTPLISLTSFIQYLLPYLQRLPNLRSSHYYLIVITLIKPCFSPIHTELYKRASVLATLAWLPPNASSAPKLELIQFFSAGTNHVVQHPIYTDSDIPLSTASGVHGPQIAEYVIMMDLIHSHNYIELYEAQKRKEWNQRNGLRVRDAVGRRVGVLGYGSIGRQGELNFRTSTFLPCRAQFPLDHTRNFLERIRPQHVSLLLYRILVADLRDRFQDHCGSNTDVAIDILPVALNSGWTLLLCLQTTERKLRPTLCPPDTPKASFRNPSAILPMQPTFRKFPSISHL